jgi:hypothetical protein
MSVRNPALLPRGPAAPGRLQPPLASPAAPTPRTWQMVRLPLAVSALLQAMLDGHDQATSESQLRVQ